MTVSTELSHEEYVGNGVTTDFDFRFRIFESKHLIVVVADSDGNETTLKNGTDYTIIGAGSYHGGKVVLNKPLAKGWKILLERDLPVVQETDLRNQGKFFAEVHEDAFDYLTMLIQKALGTFSLSLRKPTYLSNYYDAKGNRIANLAQPKLGTDAVNKDYVDNSIKDIDSKTLRVKDKPINALPNTEQRANKILAFDENGQPITVLPESGSASDVLIGLSKPTGIKAIGSNHRGNLSLDLTAIDRRPDGYNNDIQAVLDNGNDVEINKVITVNSPVIMASNQHIEGVGGNLSQLTTTSAGVRVVGPDSGNTKDYVTINNLRSSGATLTTEPGNEGYAIFLRNTKYNRITGVLADKYTGGVAAGASKSLILRDVITHDTTFHPLNPLTRDGRGGYGVITDNISDALIDGIIHDVGIGDNGRHVLYVSTGGYGNTTGNRNFIATNLIGKYLGKDDRNFMAVNVRKSTIFQLNNINVDGANSGVSFNAENGEITDFSASNLQLDVIKYADGVGVYGVSMPKHSVHIGARYLLSNFNIRVRPKDSTITGADCVGVATGYQNGMITNGLISVPASGSPILVNDGADNTTISNIHDTILPGYSGETAAMISFTGNGVRNITVRGITTNRPMFARLHVVTDLVVDFTRMAQIYFSNGTYNKHDPHSIFDSITPTATGVIVKFRNHVTLRAIEDCTVEMIDSGFCNKISVTSKTLTINTFNNSGGVQDMTKSTAAVRIILFS
ncbi:MAG: hypothetical protein SO066_00515 [Proteus mirabilis]|nr:hypothetical protein [Proteus mirabilis]